MLDAARRGVEPVEAAPRADVDVPGEVFGDDPGAVARMTFGGRVSLKAGPLGFGVVNADQAAAQRGDLESPRAV